MTMRCMINIRDYFGNATHVVMACQRQLRIDIGIPIYIYVEYPMCMFMRLTYCINQVLTELRTVCTSICSGFTYVSLIATLLIEPIAYQNYCGRLYQHIAVKEVKLQIS